MIDQSVNRSKCLGLLHGWMWGSTYMHVHPAAERLRTAFGRRASTRAFVKSAGWARPAPKRIKGAHKVSQYDMGTIRPIELALHLARSGSRTWFQTPKSAHGLGPPSAYVWGRDVRRTPLAHIIWFERSLPALTSAVDSPTSGGPAGSASPNLKEIGAVVQPI